MKSPRRLLSLPPFPLRVLGVIVLGPLAVDSLPAQAPEGVPRAAASGVRKRAPLLLAEQAMANVPEETKRKLAAKAAGRPAIPIGKRRYLVHLHDETDPAAFAKGRGIACESTFIYALKGFVACLDDATVDALRDAGEVQGIEEDRPAAEASSQTISNGLKRMSVEQFPTAKINGLDERLDVDVAVMDGGVQINHPDLNVYRTFSTFGAYNEEDHGTASAGVIGALDNDFGVVGIAPGVRIWGIHVPGGSSMYLSDIYVGFEYVAEHADEIEVVNCSFGTYWGNENARNSYQQLVRNCVNKGVVVVCSAGNNGKDLAGANGILDDGAYTDNTLPAGFPESVAVSAMDPMVDQFVGYSNFSTGNHANRTVFSTGGAIDVVAPTNAATTTTGGTYTLSYNGTSCAAPHVTGLVALYITKYGRATDAAGVYRIRQAIVDASIPQPRWRSANTFDPDTYPEGLAHASPSWAMDRNPQLAVTKSGDTITLQFPTLSGYTHTVQQSEALESGGSWLDLYNTPGNGMEKSWSFSSQSTRMFFRLATEAPVWPPLDPVIANNLGSAGSAANGRYINQIRGIAGALAGDGANTAVNQTPSNAGGRVAIPYQPVLNPDGPFSMEIWVKPGISGTPPYLFNGIFASSLDHRSRRGWWLGQYDSSGGLNGFACICDTGESIYVFAATPPMSIDVNQWYHVVCVFNGASMALHLNGNLAATTVIPSGQTYRPNLTRDFSIGCHSSNGNWYQGALDEAAFYPHALSAAQVLAHYQAGINPAPPVPYPQVILADNPAGYWRFNEP
jgi:hypothetical protein